MVRRISPTVTGLFRVYFFDELEDFSTYILDVLMSAYCFAGYLGESRSRNFSREHLTILKGMLRIVAIGQNQGWKVYFPPGRQYQEPEHRWVWIRVFRMFRQPALEEIATSTM